MREVPDQSVHLAVTSPPYWQLKDYGDERQIGFNDTYEDYIHHLSLVWRECWRVLLPGCRLCVNIGDQFARSVYYGRYKVIPIRTEINKFCETLGFDAMGAIIWQKVTTTNTTGGATIMGSFPYPRNGIVKLDYEFILLFRKPGKPPKVSGEQKEGSRLTIEEWNQYFSGHWNFSGVRQDGHLAMFPEELPRRLIRMFSFVGDTVLDPFLGSGTTSLAARRLGRNSIGYEINRDFLPIIEEKLGASKSDLFGEFASVEVVEQAGSKRDFSQEIATLPYIFRDPVKFDRKVDPRKLRFGSKVDGSENGRSDLYIVKQVESPTQIELNTGLRVRLLGVKPILKKKDEAIRFLHYLIHGKKVFLKFDDVKYDPENNLLGYLYLKNKTFVNAHLIKNGFAQVDTSIEYKYKARFLRYQNGISVGG
ncbi:MAG: site-specific DNA-methyltransferase [Candidatus Latescibacteria bacterium]|nr:site-specific DNA-methyltransferase [Candidatus Latescibacterota bacterium]